MPSVPSRLEREASEPHKAFLGEGRAILNQKSGIILSADSSPPCSLTPFGAGPQQVDDVEVRPQVAHDLQLGHEGLLLAAAGRGCWAEPG